MSESILVAQLLTQITEIQARVYKLETSNSALKSEVDLLKGNSMTRITPQWAQQSAQQSAQQWVPHTPKTGRIQSAPNAPVKGPNPNPRSKVSIPYPTMSMSDVLAKDETVEVEIKTSKGNAIAVCTFDGTDLTVTACEMVESIIGLKSSRPGDILYKFRDALIKLELCGQFTCPPWRLCFVKRDGVKKSLEELRKA